MSKIRFPIYDLRFGSITTTITNTDDRSETLDGLNDSAMHHLGLPTSDPDRDWGIHVRKQL